MKSRPRPQLIDGVEILDARAHVTVCRSIASQLVELEGLPTIAQRYDRLLQLLPLLGAEGLTGPPGAPRARGAGSGDAPGRCSSLVPSHQQAPVGGGWRVDHGRG